MWANKVVRAVSVYALWLSLGVVGTCAHGAENEDAATLPILELDRQDLLIFDASMPVIDNEVARLQLDEWYARLTEATDKHPAVHAAKYGELESISSIGEAKALLYPQVSLALSGDFEQSVRDGSRIPVVTGLDTEDKIRVNPKLTINQLLFDGGATSARVEAAEARSDSAKSQRISAQVGVALRAADTLIQLAKLQEQLIFAKENLQEISRLRDMIRERVTLGRDAPSEMLQMNTRVYEAQNQVVRLQGLRAEAGARHEEVFGEPPVILAFPDIFAPIPMSLESGLDIAIRQNPDLRSSQAMVSAAKSDLIALKADGLPRVEVEARLTSYDASRSGLDFYDTFVGVTVKHKIFDGGLQNSAEERSRNKFARSESEHESLVREVEMSLNRAYANRQSLIPQYKALQTQLEHNIETRKAYEEQFLAGRRPLNDLISAQQQVLEVALQVVDYRAELHRQHFAILSLIGDLSPGLRI
jgi:adhesin transport system outer membrane protein